MQVLTIRERRHNPPLGKVTVTHNVCDYVLQIMKATEQDTGLLTNSNVCSLEQLLFFDGMKNKLKLSKDKCKKSK